MRHLADLSRVSIEAFERAEQERHLLRLLARGEKEIAAGEGYDLDDVLGEADTLLARRTHLTAGGTLAVGVCPRSSAAGGSGR